MEKFKNRNLWKLSHWRIAKSPERICDIFGGNNIMYFGLYEMNIFFQDSINSNYGIDQ